jgi:hypothetical protein
MQTLIISLLLLPFLQGLSLHTAAPPVIPPSWTSDDGSQWSGYNPDCELACSQSGGQSCDSYPKTCCSQGECTNKFNFTTCKTPLPNFNCSNPVKRGIVFASPNVPELQSVNQ